MGRPPKKPETIGLEAEEGGAFTLRVPAWLSRKAVTLLGAAIAASTGGAWFGVQKMGAVDERFDTWAQAQAAMQATAAAEDAAQSKAIIDRLARIEAAQIARVEVEARFELVASDIGHVRQDVQRLEREARRGERRR